MFYTNLKKWPRLRTYLIAHDFSRLLEPGKQVTIDGKKNFRWIVIHWRQDDEDLEPYSFLLGFDNLQQVEEFTAGHDGYHDRLNCNHRLSIWHNDQRVEYSYRVVRKIGTMRQRIFGFPK